MQQTAFVFPLDSGRLSAAMKKWHKWLGLLLLLSPPSHISALPSCTVTSFSAIPAAVANCTSITLQDIAVPGGSSLNLTGLKTGSIVNFAGTTSFGFANASYDMITVSNAMNVTIQATSGGLINGNGQAWVSLASVSLTSKARSPDLQTVGWPRQQRRSSQAKPFLCFE